MLTRQVCWIALAAGVVQAQMPAGTPEQAPTGELRHGRELLMARHFAEAKVVFSGYLETHPEVQPGPPSMKQPGASPGPQQGPQQGLQTGVVQAVLGLGDAELGLHQYEAAELTYRHVTALQPQLWQAHKNLVVVEAALGRWEEFDRERTVLRMARERGAAGISTRESDVIDSFDVHGEHWVVRAYFEPLGRSEARYNFERFAENGRVQTYISLEDAAAAKAALTPLDERVGAKGAAVPANSGTALLALNWYTGAAHGVIRSYPTGEPAYPRLRMDVMHWLATHPDPEKASAQSRSPAGHAAGAASGTKIGPGN